MTTTCTNCGGDSHRSERCHLASDNFYERGFLAGQAEALGEIDAVRTTQENWKQSALTAIRECDEARAKLKSVAEVANMANRLNEETMRNFEKRWLDARIRGATLVTTLGVVKKHLQHYSFTHDDECEVRLEADCSCEADENNEAQAEVMAAINAALNDTAPAPGRLDAAAEVIKEARRLIERSAEITEGHPAYGFLVMGIPLAKALALYDDALAKDAAPAPTPCLWGTGRIETRCDRPAVNGGDYCETHCAAPAPTGMCGHMDDCVFGDVFVVCAKCNRHVAAQAPTNGECARCGAYVPPAHQCAAAPAPTKPGPCPKCGAIQGATAEHRCWVPLAKGEE